METVRKTFCIASVFFLATLVACVTINIYFPAEKVESVAGDIVDEIRGRSGEEGTSGKTGAKESLLHRIRIVVGVGPAWADEVTEISNATIRALKDRMKARYQQLSAFYSKGLISEGNDGYLQMKDLGSLGLKEKRDLTSLVDAENKDRKALYNEVAKALNIDPSQVDRIAKIFAKEWQK